MKARAMSARAPFGRPPKGGAGGSKNRAKSARQMQGSLIKKLEVDYDTCKQEWEALNEQMKEQDHELELLNEKLEQARLMAQHHHIAQGVNRDTEGEGVNTADEGGHEQHQIVQGSDM